MTTETQPTLDFLSELPLSLRAIDQNWVNQRAVELVAAAESNAPIEVSEARYQILEEIVERLGERLGSNLRDDALALLFSPSNETDPYVVGLPIDGRSSHQKRIERAKETPRPAPPQVSLDYRTVRADFEDGLFQTGEYELSVLDKDEDGNYLEQWVTDRWKGFQMFYNQMVIANSGKFKNKYSKTLGRYVVGKIANNGAALFVRAPFRHETKAGAFQEANNLSTEHASPFGVFRCLDIIDNS